ncbi:acetyltransferase [Flavobacterium nitratireducens]|uniref:acetyltransferase n=1 Tax=Flavobacterium nitratireducens TaxID=992289 RepID=UPI002414E976|nr:acetyltransferase [Flavobacterium nitratireducens]
MYLYGASGHGKVVAEIAEENNIAINAFIDADQSKKELLDYEVIHHVPVEAVRAIISIGNNAVRKRVVQEHDFDYQTLCHLKSKISKRATIGKGTVIMAGAIINSDTIVGQHCIINTNATVDHDCVLEDYVHISPNAGLAGDVKVGEGTQVGIGAVVIQGVKIGKWCMIGAGSVITKDVPDGATVVGNPGRVIKIKEISNL